MQILARHPAVPAIEHVAGPTARTSRNRILLLRFI